jgi:hypothetical protein
MEDRPSPATPASTHRCDFGKLAEQMALALAFAALGIVLGGAPLANPSLALGPSWLSLLWPLGTGIPALRTSCLRAALAARRGAGVRVPRRPDPETVWQDGLVSLE